jgi:hypothetical protein
VNPDIWENVGTFNGNPHKFSLILKDPDYGIPTKNIWIIGSNPELRFVVESRIFYSMSRKQKIR